jgi:3-hydroxyacyl-[acyl-carrier-protein] dehydratase
MSAPITLTEILNVIPQRPPFRFIDELEHVDGKSSTGKYRFRQDEHFYKGHFPEMPITPSVILIETMAQIGLIPLGIYNIYLQKNDQDFGQIKPIFTTSNVKFLAPVYPQTEVTVIAEKIYFRLNKLKAKVKMINESGEKVCSGELSGIFVDNKKVII